MIESAELKLEVEIFSQAQVVSVLANDLSKWPTRFRFSRSV